MSSETAGSDASQQGGGSSSLTSGSSTATASSASENASRLGERMRRKAVAHYDIQSISASPTSATRLNELLAKRRNTTTGASAASQLSSQQSSNQHGNNGAQQQQPFTRGSNPTSRSVGARNVPLGNSSSRGGIVLDNATAGPVGPELDPGDPTRCNDLVDSCPFFRNEVGGEPERLISLSCFTSASSSSVTKSPLRKMASTSSSPAELSANSPTSPSHRQPQQQGYQPQHPHYANHLGNQYNSNPITKSHSSSSLLPSTQLSMHYPSAASGSGAADDKSSTNKQRHIPGPNSLCSTSSSHHSPQQFIANNNNNNPNKPDQSSPATSAHSNKSTPTKETNNANNQNQFYHRPQLSWGLAILESGSDSRWKNNSCPYQWGVPGYVIPAGTSGIGLIPWYGSYTGDRPCPLRFPVECVDVGASYYRKHFFGLEHQNWIGIDDKMGPIAISIRRERCVGTGLLNLGDGDNQSTSSSVASSSSSAPSPTKHQYRIIIRTAETRALRCTIHEDNLAGLIKHSNSHSNHHAKEVLELIAPEINLPVLRLGAPAADEEILRLDEQSLTKTYKVGVMYCKPGQTTEEEFYNNMEGSQNFQDFLLCLGDNIELKGFLKYRAGLDTKEDTTGTNSIYSNYADCEIMFHVSTLLPHTPNNRQQILRKRHIGNDIVTIIFQEPGSEPFTPRTIRSNFQHVFIVVRLLNPESPPESRCYQVALTRSKDVPFFGPPLPPGGVFVKSKEFQEWLLAKVINAENATLRSDKFSTMAQRTRKETLKNMVEKFSTTTTLNDASSSSAGAKLVSSLFGATRKLRINNSNSKGKELAFKADTDIRGALVWDIFVEDFSQDRLVPCFMSISYDTLVIVEQSTQEIIFVTPNCSILGWTSNPTWLKIFYHQGESLILKCKDPDLDEIGEIVTRLQNVTLGCETHELILRRNSRGSLGFTLQSDGILSEVDPDTFVRHSVLRPKSRIVEVCKMSLATLSHRQVEELLRRSNAITLTLLPPKLNGSARKGCCLSSCPYLNYLNRHDAFWLSIDSPPHSTTPHSPTSPSSGDYENLPGPGTIHVMSSSHSNQQSSNSSSNQTYQNPPHPSVANSQQHKAQQMSSNNNSNNIYSNLIGFPSPAVNRYQRNGQNGGNMQISHQGALIVRNPSHLHKGANNPAVGYRLTNSKSEMSLVSSASNGNGSNPHNGQAQHPANMPTTPMLSNKFVHHQRTMDNNTLVTVMNSHNSASSKNIASKSEPPSKLVSPEGNNTDYTPHDAMNGSIVYNGNATYANIQQQQLPPVRQDHGMFLHPMQGSMQNQQQMQMQHDKRLNPGVGNNNASVLNGLSHSAGLATGPIVGNSMDSGVSVSPTISGSKVVVYSNGAGIQQNNVHLNGSQPNHVMNQNGNHQMNNPNMSRGSNYTSSTHYNHQRAARLLAPLEAKLSSNSSNGASSTNNANARSRQGFLGSRSSSTCTLQEDLLKLINPDTLHKTNTAANDTESSSSATQHSAYSTPYSSLERSSGPPVSGTNQQQQKVASGSPLCATVAQIPSAATQQHVIDDYKDPPKGDLILTTARPAQVVTGSNQSSPSSATNGISPTVATHHKSKNNINESTTSPVSSTTRVGNDINSLDEWISRNEGIMSGHGPLGVRRSSDGVTSNKVLASQTLPHNTNLTNYSNKQQQQQQQQMKQNGTNSLMNNSLIISNGTADYHNGRDVSPPNSSLLEKEETLKKMMNENEQLRKLHTDYMREKGERITLEEEIRHLRLENAQLRAESQSASAQLRKFTEWFFQSINTRQQHQP